MLGHDERDAEVCVVETKPKEYDAEELKWSSILIAQSREMSRSDEMLPPTNRKDVGTDEVGAHARVQYRVKRTHRTVIDCKESRYEVVGRLHFERKAIFRGRVNSFSRYPVNQQEDAPIQRGVDPFMLGELLLRRTTRKRKKETTIVTNRVLELAETRIGP